MGRSRIADIPGAFPVAVKMGTNTAIASNGAGAILNDTIWVAPANLKVVSAYRVAHATEVTKGTATTSASYRRHNLINGGIAGTGTSIVASLNNTASNAATSSRAFATTANNTVTKGALLYVSHLTVGAETGDGTDVANGSYFLEYELL